VYQEELLNHEEEYAATNSMIEYASTQLNRLKRLNVVNDTFHIWEEGEFATINGFRLGRLPSCNVGWDEINAAWGQVCLLLDVIVKKGHFDLKNYRLVPRGSASMIIGKNDNVQLDLFGNEGGFTRFFLPGRKFDRGMVAFLSCVQEVYAQILQRDPSFKLPFRIDQEKIDGLQIRLQFNKEERWTKALRFLLIDLKFIVAFVEGKAT